MNYSKIEVKMPDNVPVTLHQWEIEPSTKPVANVLIIHGMAEHAYRYKPLAEFLNQAEIQVYAPDLRGHGQTAGSPEKTGFFAEKNGWNLVIDDCNQLLTQLQANWLGVPFFIFGHSMGSLLLRSGMSIGKLKADGYILSGTSGEEGLLVDAGVWVSALLSKISGNKTPSPLLDKMSFGKFNQSFKPNRTAFDWLSRDAAEVDKYVTDPYCGRVFSNRFFNDLASGVQQLNRNERRTTLPKNIPLYFFSGDNDPVGKFGKGVNTVVHRYKEQQFTNLTLKLYKNGRHESVNEVNRAEVFSDLLQWIKGQLKNIQPVP